MALHELPLAAGLYLLLLVVAAAYDLVSRRIPNRLTLVVLLAGLGWMGFAHGPIDALIALACGVGMIVLLWVPWSAGGIGGGDVKLAAAAIVWLGTDLMLAFILSGAAAGGLVALWAYGASRGEARAAMRSNLLFAAYFKRWPAAPGIDSEEKTGRKSVPYALAIMVGGIYSVLAPRFAWPH